MRNVVLALATASIVATSSPAQPPAGKEPERWVRVETSASSFLVRLAGGPPTQTVLRWEERPEKGELRNIDGHRQARFGFLVAGGKKFVFHDGTASERQVVGVERARPEPPRATSRLMLAEADGSDPRELLDGLGSARRIHPAADGRAVFCEAKGGDGWHVVRVPLDGTPPVRMSQTAGRFGVEYHALRDGRVLYRPETDQHRVPYRDYAFVTPKGPAILTDGKAETRLVPEVVGHLPAISDDGARLAVARRNGAGEEVVEVRDLNAGTAREYRVKAFNPEWTCRFGLVSFSPDGRALAVTFEFPVTGNGLPEPAEVWRPSRHVGLVWVDGRPDPGVLFEVTDPRRGGSGVKLLEWANPLAATP